MKPEFWVEALHTAVHTLNILSSISNEIPFTKLFSKQAPYDHLRVFGCLCYPNLLPQSQHKLAPRSTACVFLGYPTDHRGYRCFDLSTRKIIFSRHVHFDENTFPFHHNSSSSSSNHVSPSIPSSPPPPIPQLSPLTAQEAPPPPPPPLPKHPMVTRSQSGIVKPRQPLCLHTTVVSPLPTTHVHAAKDPYWNGAMGEEYSALIKPRTWDLVPRPVATYIVRSLWNYRHKFDANGQLARHKARLVANRKSQQQGVDCDETFSPVVKPATVRTVLHVAVAKDWPLHQLDVKNAFLNGDLEETVYMHQPPWFVDKSKPDNVCLLRRSLYDLKQAPRAWNQRFSTFAKTISFTQSVSDPSLFIYFKGNQLAYLLLYVDDIGLTASSTDLLQSIIASLHKEFEMSDSGELHYFLGISIKRSASGLLLQQQNYAADILQRANMTNCNPCSTPVDTKGKLSPDGSPISDPTLYRSLAGALQYLTFTRPDIAYAVQQICLFMHDPRELHFAVLKRILRYVKGTITHGLHITKSPMDQLIAYSDADWGGCSSTRRSTSGFGVFLGDSLISWSAKRQATVSRSSAEVEYKVVANAVAETTWLLNLLGEMRCPLSKATIVFCDNISAV